MQVGRYSKLVRPPNSFEEINKQSWVQYMDTVHTQIVTPILRVHRNDVTQSIPSQAFPNVTQVQFTTRAVDTHDWYSTSTYRYTPLISGYYYSTASVWFDTTAIDWPNYPFSVEVRRNGVAMHRARSIQSGSFHQADSLLTAGLFHCNGRTDYIDVAIYQALGVAVTLTGAPSYTYLHVFRVSP